MKEKLLESCLAVIDGKLETIQKVLDDYKKDLLSEAKSSAGDKHETGRAMLQLEMEKLGQQYQTVLVQKQALQKIEVATLNRVQAGALVLANGIYYFLATSMGQVTVDGIKVMVISAHSPIGKQLLGKQKGDTLIFNGNSIHIDEVL